MAPPDTPPPAPPEKPEPWECCGRGCCPCIFDYYEDAMERWRAVVRVQGHDPRHLPDGTCFGA